MNAVGIDVSKGKSTVTIRRPGDIVSAARGDFAKAAAVFLPLIPTNQQKAKWTLIYGNFPLFFTKPHKPK